MFYNAEAFNGDISSWDTSSVTDMSWMFRDATAFDQDLSSWDISSVTDLSYMLDGATLSTENYDALLIGWRDSSPPSGLNFHGGNSKYSNLPGPTNARNDLINVYNWNISDGGGVAPP